MHGFGPCCRGFKSLSARLFATFPNPTDGGRVFISGICSPTRDLNTPRVPGRAVWRFAEAKSEIGLKSVSLTSQGVAFPGSDLLCAGLSKYPRRNQDALDVALSRASATPGRSTKSDPASRWDSHPTRKGYARRPQPRAGAVYLLCRRTRRRVPRLLAILPLLEVRTIGSSRPVDQATGGLRLSASVILSLFVEIR